MRALTLTHGLALSNLPVFVAHERGFFSEAGVDVRLLPPRSASELLSFLRSGRAQAASCAFTSLMPLYEETAQVRIVGGAGALGLYVLARPEIHDWQALRGARAATVAADPLEILLYECLDAHGIPYRSLSVSHLDEPRALTRAFLEGRVDVVTQVEPFAGELVAAAGARVLSDGRELWGPRYPDCVLAARTEVLREGPQAVKALLRALLRAQAAIEAEPEAALRLVEGRYFRGSPQDLRRAAASMPPAIDIRDQVGVILGRGRAMVALGYLERPPERALLDLSLLEEVIGEEGALWSRLRMRAEEGQAAWG